jgi:hypothetical protein
MTAKANTCGREHEESWDHALSSALTLVCATLLRLSPEGRVKLARNEMISAASECASSMPCAMDNGECPTLNKNNALVHF